jgi:regulator of extracellular matrix RemA (YlzA/DUF370 family)
MTLSLKAPYKAINPKLIPTQRKLGLTGELVTFAKKGKGMVNATYKLNKVTRIIGDIRKIIVSCIENHQLRHRINSSNYL